MEIWTLVKGQWIYSPAGKPTGMSLPEVTTEVDLFRKRYLDESIDWPRLVNDVMMIGDVVAGEHNKVLQAAAESNPRRA